MEEAGSATRKANPLFAKLVDIISTTHQEDGVPKATRSHLQQAELKLRSVTRSYLEQQLLTSELTAIACTPSSITTTSFSSSQSSDTSVQSHDFSTRLHDSSATVTAAAELQHCLNIAPKVTLLDVQTDHLKAVAAKSKVSREQLLRNLEPCLRKKCLQVVNWHAPYRELPDSGLQLAKMKQLPGLLSQQKEEAERCAEELEGSKRENRELMSRTVQVLGEMCGDLMVALEHHKLELTARANDVDMEYLQTQCQAMLGKLDVMYHQLLKGTASEGRLQALEHIQQELLQAQQSLRVELSQTQRVLDSYQSLGEEFVALSQQYHEIREEIENKQWALRELSKSQK